VNKFADSEVELRRIGDVNAPVGSRDPVQFPVLMTSDDTLKKDINIDQNSRSQTATQSVLSVSKLTTESIGSRRELVANAVHITDTTWLDSGVASVSARRQCVLGLT